MTYLPSDRIRIFISSRLEECSKEREIAKSAIRSFNYDPVMFESAGARPYPPRFIYLRGVESSVFFIGIYGAGYGYVAEGMQISGLEDEYRYAKSIGIPQLLYMKKNCMRDTRLDRLISEFGSSITIGFYETPDELYDKIRDDITALVTEYVLRGQQLRALGPSKATVIIDELVPADRLILRTPLRNSLLKQLQDLPLIIISGPLGSGKTVFLASLASQENWVFVQCGERTPLEILVASTNGIRAQLGLEQVHLIHPEEIGPALKAGWNALESVTLVLDDVRTEDSANAILDVITPVNKRHIVISARDSSTFPGADVFPLPPLEREEIREFVQKTRQQQPLISGEIEELVTLSEGNPLYLRYYTTGKPRQFENTLKGYEIRTCRELKPRAREAVNYIALSPRPLQIEDLMDLMSSEAAGVEEIAGSLSEARSLLSESPQGYLIFHPHAKKTIRGILAESPQLSSFYASRLARWFRTKRDYIAAFSVFHCINANIPAELPELARRQAIFQGDIGSALKVLQRQIETARENGDIIEVRNLLLLLADTQGHAGKVDEALDTLESVRKLETPDNLFIPIDEVELSIRASAKGEPDAIAGLEDAKRRYIGEGRLWDAARLALDLSATFIRQCDSLRAAQEAEFALKTFEEHGDSYGAGIAKLNLLSATSCLPDKSEIAKTLLKELQGIAKISPRQRAFLCNILGRIARENNDIEGAKAYAKEAIQLGRELGDLTVIGNNLINLGNAFRQESNLKSALDQYEAADKVARESGLLQLEAKAQELIASVFNRMEDWQRATYHARYAISLVKDDISKRTEAEAWAELAEAAEHMSDYVNACDAWLHRAELELSMEHERESGIYAFLRSARLFYKKSERKLYIQACRKIFRDKIRQPKDGFSILENLVFDFESFLACIPLPYAFEASVYHARFAFDGLPKVLARQVYLRLIRELVVASEEGTDRKRRLRAALAISMALPHNILDIGDLVEIGAYLARYETDLSFRAHEDGAVHLAINLNFAQPVIVTIRQLDDRPDVSLVSICLALALLSFAKEISDEVLAGIRPPRREADICVVNYDEAKELVPLEKAGLESMENTCSVTRATDPQNDPVPIIVITREDLTSDWLVGGGRGNSGQILFAEVLIELVYHLFAGEIEIEALKPKVASLVKKTIV